MVKLKTLKDLEIETEDGDIYSTDLKQEAIKWINDGRRKLHVEEDQEEGIAIEGRIEFIKLFFNITEGELKD